MKVFSKLLVFPLTLAAMMVASCNDDDNKSVLEEYGDWRKTNMAFYEDQKSVTDGGVTPIYTVVSPSWNPGAQILIRYLSNRSASIDNLSPMLNSTCSVKYIGRLYNGEAFDSSYNYVDSVAQFMPNGVIQGWTIALMNMRVGDSARVVIPYEQAYGSAGRSSGGKYVVPPYSTLVFDMKLVDIPYYEVRP